MCGHQGFHAIPSTKEFNMLFKQFQQNHKNGSLAQLNTNNLNYLEKPEETKNAFNTTIENKVSFSQISGQGTSSSQFSQK